MKLPQLLHSTRFYGRANSAFSWKLLVLERGFLSYRLKLPCDRSEKDAWFGYSPVGALRKLPFILYSPEKWKTCNIRWMNQDRVPINEIGTRDADEGAAPQAAHRQGLVIHPCASAYSDIHFFFDEIDRAIGGDDLHPDQRVVCQEAGHDPRKRVLGKAGGATDPDCANRIRSQ